MSAKTFYKSLKSRWDVLRLRWAKLWFDRTPAAPAPALNPHNLRAVLFLRQDGKIGDYIVSAFAFREIKKANSGIKIGVLCSSKNRQLFENNPYIDALHEVAPKSTASYRTVGRAVARQYDVAIDPSLQTRARDLVLLRALDCPYNLGLGKADYQLFNLNIADTQQHFADVYAQALRLLGFTDLDTRPMLPDHPASDAAVQAFLQENGLKNYTALNFFGAANSRRFSREAIQTALAAFQVAFPTRQFVLLTYPEITPMLQEVCRQQANCFVYADTQTIHDSIALLRHADTVLTPDTAIVHIAAALNKKIVALYREDPQNFANWQPKSQQVHLLFFKQHIEEITPQQMVAALDFTNHPPIEHT